VWKFTSLCGGGKAMELMWLRVSGLCSDSHRSQYMIQALEAEY
jgi:hypothetical protein